MTMRNALAQSVNIPAIKTLYLAGMSDTLRFAKDLGVETLTDIGRYGLTLVLGGGEVRLLDMVGAYGTFANEGVRNNHTPLIEVRDNKGNILEKQELQNRRVMDKNISYLVSDVLSDNVARTPAFGAQSFLNFPGRDVAVKTGTTNDYRDAWIIGYTPEISVGAWAGNNDNRSMDKKVAGFIIAPLWNEFMNEILQELPNTPFPTPETSQNPFVDLKPVLRKQWVGGISHLIDSSNGKLATQNTPTESLDEILTGGIHSILHWVSKDNPRGPIPAQPEQDPQYYLWEYPVLSWARTQNISLRNEKDVPSEISDTNIDKNKPVVYVELPGNIKLNKPATIKLDIESVFSITKAEFYINNSYVGASTNKPFSFTFTPQTSAGILDENILRVVIYDKFSNKSEQSVPFSVSQ